MAADFEVLETLARHGVPFVVIGGHAVNFHGYLRATEDVDVVWERSPQAEIALSAALDTLQAHYISNEIDPATGIERAYPVTPAHIRSSPLMMLATKLGFLDLFDYIPGFPLTPVSDLIADSVIANGIRFVSLDWLRRMKQATGRPKDLADLEKLPE